MWSCVHLEEGPPLLTLPKEAYGAESEPDCPCGNEGSLHLALVCRHYLGCWLVQLSPDAQLMHPDAVWEASKSKGFLADRPRVRMGGRLWLLHTKCLSQVPKLLGTRFSGQQNAQMVVLQHGVMRVQGAPCLLCTKLRQTVL